jgi:DMSO/TMAO reductase YedYZ molybdopterin-dependent catalytic subunit
VPLLLSACGAPNVDWTLSISGEVSHPTSFSYKELANMPQVDLNDVYMEKSRGEDEVRSFSGVELCILLEEAGAPENFSSITAYAADGYAIDISKDELVDGIVAMKDGGEWMADSEEGPIRLVFPTTPANRWIYQITEIVVNP